MTQAQDYAYLTNNGALTLTHYTGPGGGITIPSEVDGMPVTTIAGFAFASVINLTDVTIGSSLTTIRNSAFDSCTSLRSVTIGNGVTNIGNSAFSGCTGLTTIAVDSFNNSYSTIDGVLFDKVQARLILCPGSKFGSYTVPNSVTNVGANAFALCCGLNSVTIGNSVTTIDKAAFFGCEGLTNLTIPDSVIAIGGSSFSGCTGLKAITIGDSVASIGDAAFSGCAGLTSIVIPKSVTTVPYKAFFSCTNLTDVTIGTGVVSIGGSAFSECTSLMDIKIPSGITNIGDFAFSGCTRLAAITVDPFNRAYSTIDGVLFDKVQARLIQCPSAKIGNYMVPNTVTNVGASAFRDCSSLTSVTVGDNVSSIGGTAFYGCTSLAEVRIGNNVSTIDSYTFSGCSSLTNFNIPTSVTSIGGSAFSGCTSLTGITISASVTNIGDWTFSACTSLATITLDALNPFYCSVDVVLFNKSQTTLVQCPGGKFGSYSVPNSVTNIGTGAFSGCSGLTNVTIGNAVSTIGQWPFIFCPSLRAVYFQGNAPSVVWLAADTATVFYLPGTMGWGATFGGRPTAVWHPLLETNDGGFGVKTNQFGFSITWASGMTAVVEASATLTNPTWSPVSTNIIIDGHSYFSDPDWASHPSRFYRMRWP